MGGDRGCATSGEVKSVVYVKCKGDMVVCEYLVEEPIPNAKCNHLSAHPEDIHTRIITKGVSLLHFIRQTCASTHSHSKQLYAV